MRDGPLRWSFGIVIALTVVVLVLPFMTGGGTQAVRDRHSDPTPAAIVPTVAVVTAGKLYHDPTCAFIHGPAILEPVATAVAQGFSPCPRCMGTLRRVSTPSDASRLAGPMRRPHGPGG